ncbi:PVC-type heme-binding CxxCH protein [Lacunimicrobium album]
MQLRLLVCTAIYVLGNSFWQSGQVHAQEFPALPNTEKSPTAPFMTPEKALASIEVPKGFRVTVFAAEPQVQNPIACSWDAFGRMWVAENFTYAEREQRFDLSLKDRILIFSDDNNDGKADSRKVFLDDIQMLTSLEVVPDGVYVMCPPNVLFIPDRDHNDIPDGPAEHVIDGFEVPEQNYHNYANGLKMGPDGWLYGRCGASSPGKIGIPGTPEKDRVAMEGGIFRYHPEKKVVEVLTAGTTNPWGHDWDEFYELFYVNTVNGHLWHGIPGAHFVRPHTIDPNPYAFEPIDMHADHWHFDTGQGWMASRDGKANSLGGGHAHSGCYIYQGGHWPTDYNGRLLTLNFHGRRINQEQLKRVGSGYIASHLPDMFVVGDAWFRGLEISASPDGQAMILDWSDTGECHENTGVHRESGRIYKLTYDAPRPKGFKEKYPPVDYRSLKMLSDMELAVQQTSSNEWLVRQSRLILADRIAKGEKCILGTEHLTMLLTQAPNPVHRLRAMLTLYGMKSLSDSQLTTLTRDENEHIRVWAIRLLTDFMPLDDCRGPIAIRQTADVHARAEKVMPLLLERAQKETSGLVLLTLASTLQRLPVDLRAQLARPLVSHAEYAADQNLPLMTWYGLIPVAVSHPQELVTVAMNCQWPTTRRLIARRLIQDNEKHPEVTIELVTAMIASPTIDFTRDLLYGFSQGLKGRRKTIQPVNWSKLVEKVAAVGDEPSKTLVTQLSVVFGDGEALEEVEKIALNNDVDHTTRANAIETLIEAKSPRLIEICTPILGVRNLNVVAAKGLASTGDPKAGETIVKNYNRIQGYNRPQVIAMLTSRKEYAKMLLEAVSQKKIAPDDVTAFDIRQILSLGDEELAGQVRQMWGEVQESSAEKKAQMEEIKAKLTAEVLAKADLSKGRALFEQSCVKCHKLYGQGQMIGPDLTGSNRSNIDYLLENIVDPSAVVSKNYYASIIAMEDGRVINGLITNKNEQTVTIQTQTDKMTLPVEEIAEISTTTQSPMPDGLIKTLTEEQVRDLFAYLMHPQQVALPAGTAAGN